jgi:hypothetical protein
MTTLLSVSASLNVAASTIEEDNRHLRLLHEAQIDSISFSLSLNGLAWVFAVCDCFEYTAAALMVQFPRPIY